jgi:hypothetical protein
MPEYGAFFPKEAPSTTKSEQNRRRFFLLKKDLLRLSRLF